jgi:hypothetical protein
MCMSAQAWQGFGHVRLNPYRASSSNSTPSHTTQFADATWAAIDWRLYETHAPCVPCAHALSSGHHALGVAWSSVAWTMSQEQDPHSPSGRTRTLARGFLSIGWIPTRFFNAVTGHPLAAFASVGAESCSAAAPALTSRPACATGITIRRAGPRRRAPALGCWSCCSFILGSVLVELSGSVRCCWPFVPLSSVEMSREQCERRGARHKFGGAYAFGM